MDTALPNPCFDKFISKALGTFHAPSAKWDFTYIYDNSRWGAAPTVLMQTEKGEIVYKAEDFPAWLRSALESL